VIDFGNSNAFCVFLHKALCHSSQFTQGFSNIGDVAEGLIAALNSKKISGQ
jgi:hypothetical protein